MLAPFLISIAVLRVTCVTAPCAAQPLLPAYSHNDYRNSRPLLDALDLGYRGAESDLLRRGDALLVGHDSDELDATRTLARLYLDPLRDRLLHCGSILPDSTSFLLNIELKEQDEHAFQLLLDELAGYPELFRSVATGVPRPVRVALVGWSPAASVNQPWPDYLGTQLVVGEDGRSHANHPGLSVALVTIDYGKTLGRIGRGRVNANREAALAEARRLAAAFDVPLRVHHAPESRRVYQWLLSEGVTLIGTTDLARTRALLDR